MTARRWAVVRSSRGFIAASTRSGVVVTSTLDVVPVTRVEELPGDQRLQSTGGR